MKGEPCKLRPTYFQCIKPRLRCPVGVSLVVLVVKKPSANAEGARDAGLIHVLGRYLGVGNGDPVQYSCLENSLDRGAWWTTVY